MEIVDHKKIIELSEVVERLTTSGSAALDHNELKKLKNICRNSDDYVRHCHHQLLVQLEKNHSEVRRSAFQICDELFQRSHCFRDLLLEDFQLFLQLTADIDPEIQLPPPKAVAKQLKASVLQAVNRWHLKYGEAYKKLDLGHKFLKCCKKVDFEDLEARSAVEQQREDERRTKLEEQRRTQLKKAVNEMTEFKEDIDECVAQAENCLMLLISSTDTFTMEDFSSEPMQVNSDKDSNITNDNVSMDKLNQDSVKPLALKSNCCEPNLNYDEKLKDLEYISGNKSLDVASSSKGKATQGLKSKSSTKNIITDIVNRHTCDTKATLAEKEQCNSTAIQHLIISLGEKQEKKINTDNEQEDVERFLKPSPKGYGIRKRRSSELCSDKSSVTENVIVPPDVSPEKRSRRSSTLTSEGSDLSTFEDDDIDDLMTTNSLRHHGVFSQLYSIDINVSNSNINIKESSDNRDILLALKDSKLLILNKFLPSIQSWMQAFSKCGGDQCDVRKALDIKERLQKVMDKISNVHVTWAPTKNKQSVDNDDDDEDEFEEVESKEGYEPRIPDELREEYGLVPAAPRSPTRKEWRITSEGRSGKVKEQDPLSWSYHMERLKAQESKYSKKVDPEMGSSLQQTASSPIKKERSLKAKAPVIPYGTDLIHWGEKAEKPLLVRYDSEHRFWTSKDNEDVVDLEAEASMKSRVINYVGEFKPVKWTCRAPLPSGELCPRQDRYKCPLHGPVIARNEVGMPVGEEQSADSQPEQSWEDEELQRDIEAATGVQLTRKSKSKSKKETGGDVPGLTDIKKPANPTRTRLEKKILSRGAVQRVSTAMDNIAHKRHKDKFANNFNYTFTH